MAVAEMPQMPGGSAVTAVGGALPSASGGGGDNASAPSKRARADDLEESLLRIQSVCEGLISSVANEEKETKRARIVEQQLQKRESEKLEEKESQLSALNKRLELFISTAEDQIALNVGGQPFVTTRQTLLAVPDTVFTVLLSGRFTIDRVEGAIRLDRDPTYFPYILNYLRSVREEGGETFSLKGVPLSSAVRIAHEAEFYGLELLKKMAKNCTSLIVSKEVDATYSTVSQALEKAQNGDRIVVFPGTYYDSITVDKDVEIIGEGPRDKIVLVTTDGTPTATFDGEGRGRLINISLREMSRYGTSTLNIKGRSHAFLEHCDLSTRQEANTVTVFETGSLTMTRCRIHGAKGSAVQLKDRAHALIRENDFVNIGAVGLLARMHSTFVLTGNVISQAQYGGVDADESSEGTIANNSISRCWRGGVILHGKARASITGNVIHRCEYGVNAFPGSSITKFEHNRVYDNSVSDLMGIDGAVQVGHGHSLENTTSTQPADGALSSTQGTPNALPADEPIAQHDVPQGFQLD